jgi:antitoxin component of MazEF toxin-antitoxin module
VDVRNIQKTGNMFYVYLPTAWCKQFSVKAGTKVSTQQKNDGSLQISADLVEPEMKKLNLLLSKDDMSNINKLIVGCYVNPLKSFTINLEKDLDIKKLLLQKKLFNVEMVEFDGKHITCESPLSVDDPLSLLKTMIKKVKNLLYVMKKNYNKDLVERYEEEIDRSKMHVSKSVIAMLSHSRATKHKIVELHFMAMMARDLERLVDHLKEIPLSEKRYLDRVDKAIITLDDIFSDEVITYEEALEFAKRSDSVPYMDVRDSLSYHKVRVKAAFEALSETLINWMIMEQMAKVK